MCGGAVVEALRYTTDVTGSILEAVIGIFRWINLSDRTMALGSTRSLTVVLPRYELNLPIVMKLEASKFW
jgi:hypothetical protein